MTQKDLWKTGDRIKCPNHRIWMDRVVATLEGIEVRAWRCPKCGEEAFHPLDSQIALLTARLKREGIKVKIGQLREGPYVRFPKELSVMVHKGDTAVIRAKSKDEFLIKINHND